MISFEQTTELTTRNTVEELVRVWNDSANKIRQAFAMIGEAEDNLKAHFGDICDWYNKIDPRDPNETINKLERRAWGKITERLKLRTVLSKRRIEELNKQLETGEGLPPLTVENLQAMLESNMQNLEKFAEEKVQEVYQYLRPERSRLVTNQRSVAAGIGKKVILSFAVENWGTSGWHVNHYCQDDLRAVDQVFHLLDGKQPPDDYYGELSTELLKQTKETRSPYFETKYFKGRCCANRNLHLEFKRPDLVRLFNLVAGGMRLTDARSTNSKS